MKTTPGPWRVGKPSGSTIFKGNTLIAVTKQLMLYEGGPETELANARLIAAAPTMDVAIRAMIVNINLALKGGSEEYLKLAIEAGENAIAFSEGKEE